MLNENKYILHMQCSGLK